MGPSEIRDLLGFVISGGATVIVAGIGAWAMKQAKRTPPAAEPTPVQDVWAENWKRGAEIKVLNGEIKVVRAAYTVALDWIERALRIWNRGDAAPALSRREYEILEKAGEELPFEPAYRDQATPREDAQ